MVGKISATPYWISIETSIDDIFDPKTSGGVSPQTNCLVNGRLSCLVEC